MTIYIVTEHEPETSTDLPICNQGAFLSLAAAHRYIETKEEERTEGGRKEEDIWWEVEPLGVSLGDRASDRLRAVRLAIELLSIVRELLKVAKARKTLERLRLTLTSAKGAERNADRWAFREAHPEHED